MNPARAISTTASAVSRKAASIDALQPIYALVADDFAAVNQLIPNQLHSDVSLVEEISSYIVESGGKRLRPLLVLLTTRALGYEHTSHVKLAANQNAHNRPVPLYPVPDAPAEPSAAPKAEASMSTSQRFFRAPAGEEARAQFEPTFVKLDKVVLRFFGFFKEAVVESNLENWRV